jgi:hypothetical protein
MRTALALSLLLAGCYSIAETHGNTAHDYQGAVPLLFTNASPDRVCGLYLSFDKDDAYGDNWLPEAGVPSGGSVDFKVKPGTYKAKWHSCKDAKDVKEQKLVATNASTRVHQNAIELTKPTQLFAFIPGAVPPTSYAPVKQHFLLVRFEGHTTVMSASVDKDENR